MNRKILQKALNALDIAQSLLERSQHYDQVLNAYTSLRDELAKPEQKEKRCQYCDGTGEVHDVDGEWRGSCNCGAKPEQEPVALNKNMTLGCPAYLHELAKPEQEPVAHLWECIGRWSAYLATNGKQGNLAPPTWLVDAVKAATASPRKEWVGLNAKDLSEIPPSCFEGAIWADAKLKEKNT